MLQNPQNRDIVVAALRHAAPYVRLYRRKTFVIKAGGEVFADTAQFVAHERARVKIIGEKRATAVPTRVFKDQLAIELGGTRVELVYVGRNHSDNSLVMRFPAARTIFAVDFIPVDSLAFRTLNDGYMEEWIESLERVEAMDFDVIAPGHGALGRKQHVTTFREYLQTLYDEVLAGARAGRSLDDLKRARSGSRNTPTGRATSRCANSTSRACTATCRSSASPTSENRFRVPNSEHGTTFFVALLPWRGAC